MNREEIIAKMHALIQPYLPEAVAISEVKPESDFLRDLKINSAHLVDIVLDMEGAFDIQISDDELEAMRTVGDAIALIDGKVNGA